MGISDICLDILSSGVLEGDIALASCLSLVGINVFLCKEKNISRCVLADKADLYN